MHKFATNSRERVNSCFDDASEANINFERALRYVSQDPWPVVNGDRIDR